MTRFLLVAASILSVLLATYSPSGASDLLSILNKHVDALGERDSISAIKSVTAFSTVEALGLSGRAMVMIKFPVKYFMRLDLGVISQQKGFDGITGWAVDANGMISRDIEEELKPMINELFYVSFSYLISGRNPGRIIYHGDTLIYDKPYHHLKLYPDGGDSVFIYINAETGLVDHKIDIVTGIKIITTYSDFRRVAGITVPFGSTSRGIDAPYEIVERMDSVRINPELPDSLFRVPGEPSVDYIFPDKTDSVIVPFRLKNNSIRVKVRVNGRGPFEFLLDSGAGSIMLSRQVADSLDVAVHGEAPARGVGGFGTVNFGLIDSLHIGQLVLHLKRIIVFDNAPVTESPLRTVDGILGYDFFARFPMRVNFEKKDLILFNPEGIGPDRTGERIGVDIYCQLPLIEACINGLPVRLAVDLGANAGIVIMGHSDDYEEMKKEFDSSGLVSEIQGLGGSQSVVSGHFDSLVIGGHRIDNPRVLISDDFHGMPFPEYIDGLLGVPLLKEFNLLIDYDKDTIYFERWK